MAAALYYSCTVQRGRNVLERVTVDNTYVWMISVRFEEKCEKSQCEKYEFEEIGRSCAAVLPCAGEWTMQYLRCTQHASLPSPPQHASVMTLYEGGRADTGLCASTETVSAGEWDSCT